MNVSRLFILSILLLSSRAIAIEQQKAANWCWAASVQDVIGQVGIYEPQELVAVRLTGWPQNRPAYINEVVSLVQSYGLGACKQVMPEFLSNFIAR